MKYLLAMVIAAVFSGCLSAGPQTGLLKNATGGPVTFVVTGDHANSLVVAPGQTVSITLPKGSYFVQVYKQGQSHAYRSGWLRIDGERGDATLDGTAADFFTIAP